MSSPEKFLATTTPLNAGVARCDECGEIMLEDDRHWHEREPGGMHAPQRLTRKRTVEITEEWVRTCDEPPGCKNADPFNLCCGEGFWQLVSED